ncbi:MAG: PLP-dependent aminotransferase family protein [Pseudohongiellaceae bacterium]
MISFAGGLPAPDAMPELSIHSFPKQLLQYGESEGDATLRDLIAQRVCKSGLECSPEQVVVLSGSQQGIDLAAKLFIDSGSQVAVETPTYLAALQVFTLFGAELVPFEMKGHEVVADQSNPRFLYTVPTFQNPSGFCYGESSRQNLAEYCETRDLPLFEDDPYRELNYENCRTKPVCGYLKQGSWLYQGSFSKSFAPGLRVGFMVCSEDLLTPILRLKQAADLHSCRLSQWLVTQFLDDSEWDTKMEDLRMFYVRRRNSFEQSLRNYFGDLATWQQPPGGLFYWLRLNQKADLDLLLQKALEKKVAFMPGDHFFPGQSQERKGQYIRLNFSHAEPAKADEGLDVLANLVMQHCQYR